MRTKRNTEKLLFGYYDRKVRSVPFLSPIGWDNHNLHEKRWFIPSSLRWFIPRVACAVLLAAMVWLSFSTEMPFVGRAEERFIEVGVSEHIMRSINKVNIYMNQNFAGGKR